MLKRLFAPRRSTRPVTLHFLSDSGPHITLRDLTRHLALIGPPAETLSMQQHLAAQLLSRHLPVSALCVPNDPARPTLPPPSLVLNVTPEQSAEQLVTLLRRSLEHHATSSPTVTNLLLYTPRVPPRSLSDQGVMLERRLRQLGLQPNTIALGVLKLEQVPGIPRKWLTVHNVDYQWHAAPASFSTVVVAQVRPHTVNPEGQILLLGLQSIFSAPLTLNAPRNLLDPVEGTSLPFEFARPLSSRERQIIRLHRCISPLWSDTMILMQLIPMLILFACAASGTPTQLRQLTLAWSSIAFLIWGCLLLYSAFHDPYHLGQSIRDTLIRLCMRVWDRGKT